jgi:hypothetical protein
MIPVAAEAGVDGIGHVSGNMTTMCGRVPGISSMCTIISLVSEVQVKVATG